MSPRVPGSLPQPLSGRDYAVAAAVMIVVGVVLLAGFIFFAQRLVPADLFEKFYYIVVLVFGMVCALVLFGVMKSYTRVTYKSGGGMVELGGPVAVAALVVVGGFWLVPHSDTFDLTIRPHGAGEQMIKRGKIRVEFGNYAPIQEVNSNGEADFKGVPHKYRGASVQVLPMIDGYKQEYQTKTIDADSMNLDLANPETMLKGKLVPAPPKGQKVEILIESEPGEQVPDGYGRFQALVHKNLGDRVRITVCANGRSVFDDFELLSPDELVIPTRKPGARCGSA